MGVVPNHVSQAVVGLVGHGSISGDVDLISGAEQLEKQFYSFLLFFYYAWVTVNNLSILASTSLEKLSFHGRDCLFFVFSNLAEGLVNIVFYPAEELLSRVAHGINVAKLCEHCELKVFMGWGFHRLVRSVVHCCLSVCQGVTSDKENVFYYLGGRLI